MKAFVFPGQGAQFEGMGKELYDLSPNAAKVIDQANEILGYDLKQTMFEGSAEDLKETKVTQPALFVHSIAKVATLGKDFDPSAVAGHSLGEFSALVAAGALSYESGLKLVYERAMAMQDACDKVPGTMAAILGLDDDVVERVCDDINAVVVAANYNCPGQLVISGSIDGINQAVEALQAAGARRALVLPVGGAFHSPLMEPARERLAAAIMDTTFQKPSCPIYQNVDAKANLDVDIIKSNLVAQLTGAVRWTQSVQNMISDGITQFAECGGNGKVLGGLIKKVDRSAELIAI